MLYRFSSKARTVRVEAKNIQHQLQPRPTFKVRWVKENKGE